MLMGFVTCVAATAARDRRSDRPAEPARKSQQGERFALETVEKVLGWRLPRKVVTLRFERCFIKFWKSMKVGAVLESHWKLSGNLLMCLDNKCVPVPPFCLGLKTIVCWQSWAGLEIQSPQRCANPVHAATAMLPNEIGTNEKWSFVW